MSEPWDLTETQRRQLREAHAAAKVARDEARRSATPTLVEQTKATLDVNGFIRFRVAETGADRVTVTLDAGHYRDERHQSLTLARMANRLMDRGLLTEIRDGHLYVSRRRADR